MDKVLLKFLKKEIEFYFKDFRAEDLNTNFFRGNVELSNLNLNTDVVQDAISTFVPYIEVESAVVEKFRLRVPFSSIKAKPTEVYISKIDVKCKEPVNFVAFQESIKTTIERTQKEIVKTGKLEYSLMDRILDGLQITIDHIHVSFGLLGRFKHAKPGLWTPHVLDINIYDVQVYSVDENWKRWETLKETREYTHGKPHVWHFKEATCKVSARLVPPKDYSGASIPVEHVPVLDRQPVKFRLTQQRLNINETIGTELTLILGDTKMSFSPSQLALLIYWVDALSSAAFRRDLKVEEKPVSLVVVQKPNTLFSIIWDKFSIAFKDKDRSCTEFEVNEFHMNRVLQADLPGETMTRFLISQVTLR